MHRSIRNENDQLNAVVKGLSRALKTNKPIKTRLVSCRAPNIFFH